MEALDTAIWKWQHNVRGGRVGLELRRLAAERRTWRSLRMFVQRVPLKTSSSACQCVSMLGSDDDDIAIQRFLRFADHEKQRHGRSFAMFLQSLSR
eukprot:1717995-Amphidinium_carterae.1